MSGVIQKMFGKKKTQSENKPIEANEVNADTPSTSQANTKAASVDQTMQAINAACRAKGGKYAEYSCKTVSWDDVQRGEVGGSLSCWGANITDTYLTSKDGTGLFTVRSDNWNEKLGYVSANEVALVQGNQSFETSANLEPITLATFLKGCGEYGGYAGLECETLSNEDLDKKVSIRFQTTFLPVADEELAATEFAAEAYNYNTRDDEDPRNLVLLCSSQGLALQQDGAGTKKIYHHAVDEDGEIHRYWLEAERSKHKVGGQQVESKEDKEDALKRGKATSSVIGIKAMGTRFDVLLTVQIPLEQQKKPERSANSFAYGGMMKMECAPMMAMSYPAPMMQCEAMPDMLDMCDYSEEEECEDYSFSCDMPRSRCARSASPTPPKVGTANAARVSRGTEVDTWNGLSIAQPKRNPCEHITVTCVIYFTIAGGVPSEADVVAAVDDMEALYEACTESGRLADATFDFMKKELTVKDVIDIKEKINTQPCENWESSK